MSAAIVIPVYKPAPALLEVVSGVGALLSNPIVVVDDGSGAEFEPLFERLKAFPAVCVLRHAVNLGKGAALKTGMNYVLVHYPGFATVTVDGDGQHAPEDVARIVQRHEEQPESLVLGSRTLGSRTPRGPIPWRSRLGNALTRVFVRFLVGQRLTDTQTGLRAIPCSLQKSILSIASQRYEFETEMLIAAHHLGCQIIEEPIQTIYEPGNSSSHFNPLSDSMRIYFVLFRFSVLSMLTALIDNLVFLLVFTITRNIGLSQVASRAVAVCFNYGPARRIVFLSGEPHRILLPRYLALVAASGVVSPALIRMFVASVHAPVTVAKLAAESLIFLANFAVQRDFVFRRRMEPLATDWDAYYRRTLWTASLTRRYTTRMILEALHRFNATPGPVIAEIGGANSCFLDAIVTSVRPGEYHVIDTNRFGLSLLRNRPDRNTPIHLHHASVHDETVSLYADVVFSVGLIEHFDSGGTERAIEGHLRLLKPGGTLILTYPTPTALYRSTRFLAELLGVWRFPDERPILPREVRPQLTAHGKVVFEKTLWPLILTQHMIVAVKH